VACPTTDHCIAVGSSVNGTTQQATVHQLIETSTDAGPWTISSNPQVPSAAGDQLSAVTCTSTTSCVAVGAWYPSSAIYQTLIETWNGSSWTIVPSPDTSTSQSNLLSAVSCSSADACTAVGYSSGGSANISTGRPLIETWNGSGWSIATSAATASGSDVLNAVSCVSPSFCMAAGVAQLASPTNPDNVTFIEEWNGQAWSVVSSLDPSNPPRSPFDTINGISCSSSTDCFAVGYGLGTVAIQTLIEHWDGSAWSLISSPNSATNASNELTAVTCSSSSSCVAVGEGYAGAGGEPYAALIEQWNGSAWTIVPGAPTSTTNDLVTGVTCPVVGACVAVGLSGTADTLVETTAPGYREVAADGGVFAFGDAAFYGSEGGTTLNSPVVGIATDPTTGGYWEVAADGGIFAFNAPFYGSMGATTLNSPIVGITATPSGAGYREVAADGGVFAFGDAAFYGSEGGTTLNSPVVGIATDPTTGGYWEVAADGGIFAFNAPYYGSMGATTLNSPIVGITG
jgi:hypothetical protein